MTLLHSQHSVSPSETVRFYRLIEQARMPQRADRAAAGTLPMRAARYCDAVTTATAFGWYVFPPLDFSLLWDGECIFWTYAGCDRWLPLEAAQFPGFAQEFDARAPADVQGYSPPFLTKLPEPGVVQIWTGLIARTALDWSLLLRAPANFPNPGGLALYEGIIESDRWFGPLFTNVRLTRTDVPVRFKADLPLIQVQPLPRHAYSNSTLGAFACVPSANEFTDEDWENFRDTVVRPSQDEQRGPGQYAVAARRRRKGACPFGARETIPMVVG